MAHNKSEPSKYSLKKPHIYSPNYQRWRQAARTQGADSAEAVYHACQHAKQFNVHNERCGSWEKVPGKRPQWLWFHA